jgi:hypothetical protein
MLVMRRLERLRHALVMTGAASPLETTSLSRAFVIGAGCDAVWC